MRTRKKGKHHLKLIVEMEEEEGDALPGFFSASSDKHELDARSTSSSLLISTSSYSVSPSPACTTANTADTH
jgi:hypothetical protein